MVAYVWIWHLWNDQLNIGVMSTRLNAGSSCMQYNYSVCHFFDFLCERDWIGLLPVGACDGYMGRRSGIGRWRFVCDYLIRWGEQAWWWWLTHHFLKMVWLSCWILLHSAGRINHRTSNRLYKAFDWWKRRGSGDIANQHGPLIEKEVSVQPH